VIDPKGNQMHVTYASPGTAALPQDRQVSGWRRARERDLRNRSRAINDG
jgi:hypothetical protein